MDKQEILKETIAAHEKEMNLLHEFCRDHSYSDSFTERILELRTEIAHLEETIGFLKKFDIPEGKLTPDQEGSLSRVHDTQFGDRLYFNVPSAIDSFQSESLKGLTISLRI